MSFVRTIVTPRSRSAWISVGPRRHSVRRVVTSVDVEAEAMSVEVLLVAAPVVLVEPAPAAPVVPVLVLVPGCCEVVSLAIVVLLLVLGWVELVSVVGVVDVLAVRLESVALPVWPVWLWLEVVALVSVELVLLDDG